MEIISIPGYTWTKVGIARMHLIAKRRGATRAQGVGVRLTDAGLRHRPLYAGSGRAEHGARDRQLCRKAVTGRSSGHDREGGGDAGEISRISLGFIGGSGFGLAED